MDVPEKEYCADGRPSTARYCCILLGFLLVCYVGWRSPNHYTGSTPFWDSSGFLTVTYNMQQGRILYKEIFDHKPPLFFFMLYFVTQGQDDLGVNAVRTLEKVNAAVLCGLAFVIVMLFLRSLGAAVVAGCLLAVVHFQELIIRGGNLSEEYANTFFLFSVLFCCPQILARRPKNALVMMGFFACCAALIKEPYCIMALPWMAYAALRAGKKGGGLPLRCALLVLGVVLPLLPFVAYFISAGALSNWIDLYLIQFTYIEMGSDVHADRWEFLMRAAGVLNISVLILCFAGLSLIKPDFVRRNHYFPWMAALSYLFSLFASMGLTHRLLPNYLLTQIPPWALLQGVGVAFILSPLPFIPKRITDSIKRWVHVKTGKITLAILVAALALLLAMNFTRVSQTVGLYGMLGVFRIEEDAGYLAHSARQLLEPAKVWKRPEVTTLDRLLPREVIRRDGVMIMHQRIALYGPMHGLTAPEGTKPYFGISLGLHAMKPEYLDDCLRTLRNDRPAVLIGNRMYHFVIEHLKPALDEQYVYLGAYPLFPERGESPDPEYTRVQHYWFVRKDLLPLVDREFADRFNRDPKLLEKDEYNTVMNADTLEKNNS